MLRAILIAAACFAPAMASAQSYRMVSNSYVASGAAAEFVDADSVQYAGQKVTFNGRTVYQRPVSGAGLTYDLETWSAEADCSTSAFRQTTITYFQGSLVLRTDYPSQQLTPVAPGTIARAAVDTVCVRRAYLSPPMTAPDGWAREKFKTGF